MVPRTSAATALQWLSRKSGAGHRGPSAGSQRHFGRGDGRDVARLPAGVVFGPILWLLIMEDWFAKMDEATAEEHEEDDVTIVVQAFADDQLVLITASSLAKLEASWDRKWAACQSWASAHKLEYAPEKTTAIFVPAKSGQVRFGQTGGRSSGRTRSFASLSSIWE
jgi:hypothetical protein